MTRRSPSEEPGDADDREVDESTRVPPVEADGWHPVVEDSDDSFWASVDC